MKYSLELTQGLYAMIWNSFEDFNLSILNSKPVGLVDEVLNISRNHINDTVIATLSINVPAYNRIKLLYGTVELKIEGMDIKHRDGYIINSPLRVTLP